jgi:hypothetical protein
MDTGFLHVYTTWYSHINPIENDTELFKRVMELKVWDEERSKSSIYFLPMDFVSNCALTRTHTKSYQYCPNRRCEGEDNMTSTILASCTSVSYGDVLKGFTGMVVFYWRDIPN